MIANFGGGTRWSVVRDTLTNSTTGVIKDLEDEIRFGLSLYTSFNGDRGGSCPVLTEVSPALGNHAAIQTMFNMSQPEDETPTGESLDAVAQALALDPSSDDKIIVLATDGEPDTCAQPNPQGGQAVALQAAADAFNQGIRTFVISVGTQVSEAHLQAMANAGQGVGPMDPDAVFYQATDQQQLIDAFKAIINGLRSCSFTLQGMIPMGLSQLCSFTVDGNPVPFSDPDGWRANSDTQVELLGQACLDIQEGTVQVDITCPCGVFRPRPF